MVGEIVSEMGLDVERASPFDLARALTRERFAQRRLGRMLRQVYRGSAYHAVADAFPEYPHLKSWRHEAVPNSYWRGREGIEHAKAATTRMLSELGMGTWDTRDRWEPIRLATVVATVGSRTVFEWSGLGEMLDTVYGGSPTSPTAPTAALRAVLLGIEPWRYSSASKPVPPRHWQGVQGTERAQAATRRLLGELGWGGLSADEVALRVTGSTFLRHGLSGMLAAVYGNSPYAALADVFPELQPWQMGKAPLAYWKGGEEERRERGRQATRWLLRRMGLSGASPGEVASRVDQDSFNAHGLRGMLKHVYNSSPYEALADIIPDLHAWQMDTAPNGYWQGEQGRERAREATRGLLAQLGLGEAPAEEAARRITFHEFRSHGLTGMLANVYGNSPTAALADIFPELQPWQRGGKVPKGYWRDEQGREHARAATRWLLQQLGLDLQGANLDNFAAMVGVAKGVQVADFQRARLGGMLVHVYNNSVRAALADALADAAPHLLLNPDPVARSMEGRKVG